ncbi:MAG: hypothetical protein HYR74_10860 [Candidatus Eisenbacteria bacterium]|nr:hypothetical protein [Candidatus Eisenbacteria bacterium]
MHSNRRWWIRPLLLVAGAAWIALAWLALRVPKDAEATPSYARRYGTDCQTCHSPNPPRLNNVGMVFRRSGFRLPDADESGKLTLKNLPAQTIGEAMTIAGQIDGNIVQHPDPGMSKSSFLLSEVELIAGTSIGDHYSTQMMFIPYNDEAASELEDLEAQANFGPPESQFIVRGGKMQPLVWQKAGHGSMTPSSPLILDESSPAPIGDFAGPGLSHMLAGMEVGYMATRLHKGHLTSTMVSVSAMNGFNPDGSDARTHPGDGVDILAQATELIGSRNTANAFYYKGHTVIDPEGALPTPGPFRDEFTRYGVTGNFAPMDRIDLAAGYAGGENKSEELARTVKTKGYYGEVTGTIMPGWVATYRYDHVDPDTDTSDDAISDHVLGTTYLLQSTVFLSAEYREIQLGSAKSHGILGRIRLLY